MQTKLTPAIQKKICRHISICGFTKSAAKSAGIPYSTYKDWIRKGRVEKKGIYRNFFNAVERARAQAERKLLAKIEKGGKSDWKALAWLLERLNPREYGRQRVDPDQVKKLRAETRLIEQRAMNGDDSTADIELVIQTTPAGDLPVDAEPTANADLRGPRAVSGSGRG